MRIVDVIIIPKEIEESIIYDFFNTYENTIVAIAKKYGYSTWKIGKIISNKIKENATQFNKISE